MITPKYTSQAEGREFESRFPLKKRGQLTSFFVLGAGSQVDVCSKPEGRPDVSGSLVSRSTRKF